MKLKTASSFRISFTALLSRVIARVARSSLSNLMMRISRTILNPFELIPTRPGSTASKSTTPKKLVRYFRGFGTTNIRTASSITKMIVNTRSMPSNSVLCPANSGTVSSVNTMHESAITIWMKIWSPPPFNESAILALSSRVHPFGFGVEILATCSVLWRFGPHLKARP